MVCDYSLLLFIHGDDGFLGPLKHRKQNLSCRYFFRSSCKKESVAIAELSLAVVLGVLNKKVFNAFKPFKNNL